MNRYWLKVSLVLVAAYLFYLYAWMSAFGAEYPPSAGKALPPVMLEEELKQRISYSTERPNLVGHIIIENHSNSITQATWLYVHKALEYFRQKKPIFIILELNTPGGEVFAAQMISDGLKNFATQENIPVVAYINNWAISAGAMLAYSCRFITTAKDGSMGAAEPVIASAEGSMEAASEKVNSAIRADFANRAAFYERDPDIAEAMVDKDIILVVRDGRVVKLDSESKIKTEGPHPDEVLSAKGKLLTLNAEQMITYGVADMIIPPTRLPPLTEKEIESGDWPGEKVALFYQPFFKDIPNVTVKAFSLDWKMKFFAFLASPVVSSILMLGLMIGFYLEVTTPGFGLPGTIALTCLFLILLSSFALEIANWLELILLLVGLAIIVVELTVLPTFGLLGFIGIVFFLAGLFGMMLPGIGNVEWQGPTFSLNAAGEIIFERLAFLSGALVLGAVIIFLLTRYITPRFAAYSRLVLKGGEQEGYVAVENIHKLPTVGTGGEAATMLRPAGKVLIKDEIYDAVSSGAFIEKGSFIIVTGIDGSTLIVTQEER